MNDALAPSASAQGTISGRNWSAQMVRPLADKGVETPASFLSKSFTLDSVGGREVLYISALGLYRCFINGKRVGNDLLTPGWTSYDVRLSYQTYAVGDLLAPGENRIEIWLADGWLRSQMMWGKFPIFNTWGSEIAAIAELHSGKGDGAPLLVTDASWDSGELPVRKSGIYFGEIFDARFTPKVTAGSAAIVFDNSKLIAHETTPVRELAPLPVVKSWTDAEGRMVYDFGQNSGGYVAFDVSGEAGATVTVEHAEVLNQDGEFYNVNFRTAAARLEYTLAGTDRGITGPISPSGLPLRSRHHQGQGKARQHRLGADQLGHRGQGRLHLRQ